MTHLGWHKEAATKNGMNAEQEALAERRAALCSVFANAKRVMILWSLAEQERSVTEIALAIDASLQSTSQHLRLMKRRSILESRREGQTVFYRITQNELLQGCVLMESQARRIKREEV